MTVNAEAVDWTLFVRVTVALRHSDPAAGSLAETQLLFSANGPSSQVWQFTVGDTAPATYTWQASYAARDGSLSTSQEATSADDVLVLPPNAPGAGVERTTRVVVSAVDFAVVDLVVVDLRYTDPASGFTAEEHLVFSSDSSSALAWQFTAPGNEPSLYQWRASYAANDGRRVVLEGEGAVGEVLSLPSGTS